MDHIKYICEFTLTILPLITILYVPQHQCDEGPFLLLTLYYLPPY